MLTIVFCVETTQQAFETIVAWWSVGRDDLLVDPSRVCIPACLTVVRALLTKIPYVFSPPMRKTEDFW